MNEMTLKRLQNDKYKEEMHKILNCICHKYKSREVHLHMHA